MIFSIILIILIATLYGIDAANLGSQVQDPVLTNEMQNII